MPAIARRADVHPTTLYRRWASADALILEAVGDRSESNVLIPDTGNFGNDLEAFLHNLDDYVRSPLGRALLRIQVSGVDDASGIGSAFWMDRFSKASIMVARAVARGEIPASADSRCILELAIAPIYLHALVLNDEFTAVRLKNHVRATILAAQTL